MGLLDFGGKVLLTYKADIGDAKAKLRELSGEEKKLAESRLKQEESANRGIDRQIKGIGLLAAGIGALVGSISLAKSGLDAYAKTSDAAAKKVEGIKDASARAMSAVQESIGKTVVAMEPLLVAVSSFVEMLGKAGVAGPLAMSALALAISGNPVIAALVLGASSGTDPADVIFNAKGYIDGKRAQAKRGAEGALAAVRGFDPNPVTWRAVSDAVSAGIGRITGRGLGVDAWSGPVKFGRPGGGKDTRPVSAFIGAQGVDRTNQFGAATQGQGSTADGVARDAYGNPISLTLIAEQELWKQREAMTEDWKARLEAFRDQPTILERMIGTPTEFDAYNEMWMGLTATITAGYAAMVDGTMSFGDAAKSAAANAIKATGAKMLVRGLEETAEGIGSLASYDYAGAAQHFGAAAKFAAGAAVAGAIASQLGGGRGGGVSGGSGSGGGAYRPSAPSSPGPNSDSQPRSAPVIVVGDSFAYDSPRNRQKNAKRLTTLALGTNAVEYG